MSYLTRVERRTVLLDIAILLFNAIGFAITGRFIFLFMSCFALVAAILVIVWPSRERINRQ